MGYQIGRDEEDRIVMTGERDEPVDTARVVTVEHLYWLLVLPYQRSRPGSVRF